MSGNRNDNQEMQQRNAQQWMPGKLKHAEEKEDVFQNSWKELREHNTALQENKKSIFGIKRKDSAEMVQVKKYQEMLMDKMYAPIPKDSVGLQIAIQDIENIYTWLMDAARKYIATHKKPRTDEGRARLEMVRKTLALAEREKTTMRAKAMQLQQNAQLQGKLILFGAALTDIRGAEFDLNQYQSSRDGAGTSEVTVVHLGKEKVFCKAKEELLTPDEEVKRRYLENYQDKKEHEIYQKIQSAIDEHRISDDILDNLACMGFTEKVKQAETDSKVFEELVIDLKDSLRTADKENQLNLNLDDKDTQRILIQILYFREKMFTRKIVCADASIKNGENLSDRNILTSRTAVFLKASNVVANSNTVTLHKGGKYAQTGIVMQQAKGVSYGEVLKGAKQEGKEIIYTPEAMRQFSNLQLLDTICGQVDRHAGNIFVTITENKGKIVVTGVQGIDNDMAFGEKFFQDLRNQNRELPPFMNEKGKCMIPAIDEKMFREMQAMTKQNLKFLFGDMLKPEYLDALWDRWQGVVQVIENDAENLLVKEEQWNDAVVQKFQGYGGYAAV